MESEEQRLSSDGNNQKDEEDSTQMDKSGITDAKIQELVRTIQNLGDQLDERLNEKLKEIEIADVDKIKDYLTQLDRVELNIAVTGESGSGKSTFINAFRGVGDEDEGSAATGVVETTKEPTAYPHPKFSNVKLWDLPGIGTRIFKADEYKKQVHFDRYDFFIIITSDRFRECHSSLAAEILKMKKRFYFVRSKIDINIEAEKRKKMFDENAMLDEIKANCLKGLKRIGLTSPAVFLISCFELHHYDFYRLVERVEAELSQHKRNLLILALPNFSLEINERKRKALQYDIWRITLCSMVYVGGVNIRVLNATTTITVDVNVIRSALEKCYSALSWDAHSLKKLSKISGRSVDELQANQTPSLHRKITNEFVISLLTDLNLIEFQPSLISLATHFLVVYNILKYYLTELAKDAQKVLTVVLQSSV